VARIFVRLRLRLLANSLTGSGAQLVGLVLTTLGATVVGVGGFAAVASSRLGEGADVVVVLSTTSLVLAWFTFPLIGFGAGTTIDPKALVGLPLPRRTLMAGLSAAALVGPGTAITVAIMTGAVVALGSGPARLPVLVAAAAIQTLVCVTMSRAVTTFLGGALRSRRGRDLRVLAVFVIVLLPQTLRFFLPRAADIDQLRSVSRVLGWLPLVWPARAMVAVAESDWILALALLVGSVGLIALLVLWWASSLDRMLTTAEAGSSSPRRRTAQPSIEPLFGRALRWLPRDATGAVAARELRLTWRDPRRRIALISSVLLPFIVAGAFISGGGIDNPAAVYLCVILVVLGGGKAFNQLGIDGISWTVHEAAASDLRHDLDGKAVAAAVIQAVELVVVAVILAVPSGGWSELAPAVLFAVALTGPQLGIGNMASLRTPIPMPSSGTNLWGTASPGDGCLSGVLVLVAMLALLVVAAPFAIAALLVPGPWARLALAVVAVPSGLVLYRALTTAAVRWAEPRRPEILAKLATRPG
jgi:ABC-2 type transport system permease protein